MQLAYGDGGRLKVKAIENEAVNRITSFITRIIYLS